MTAPHPAPTVFTGCPTVFTGCPIAFIGCDVGKAEIVVFDSRTGHTTAWPNQAEALDRCVAALDGTCLVVCEATGGYEAALLDAAHRAKRPAHRADAGKVKAFIRSYGTLGKTDAIDARALAQYGRERHKHLPLWQPTDAQPTDAQRAQLHALVLTRRDMVADHTAWTNRRTAPSANTLQTLIEPVCAALLAQIQAIDRQIEDMAKACQTLKRDLAVLQTVNGIGRVTATAVLALMPELGTLTNKQAAALAGLAPHPNQSGTRDGYRPVRGGRTVVRAALFMGALAASRSNTTPLGAFYKHLIARGKKPIVAITALMRKMIVICNARLRDQARQTASATTTQLS